MARFSHFLAIDWSGAKGERHKGIALALAKGSGGSPALLKPRQPWSRERVLDFLLNELPEDTLVGMDLGISLPHADYGAFFPDWDLSPPHAKALWRLIDKICGEDPNLEASGFVRHEIAGRYYRHGKDLEGDRFHLPAAATREGRFRVTEEAQRQAGCRPVSNFNLVGAAQVGKSSLTGMRMLHKIGGQIPVWPIDPLPDAGSAIVEIYTSLAAREAGVAGGKSKMRTYADLNKALESLGSEAVRGRGAIDDHSSDALLTAAWLRKVADEPARWRPTALTPEIAQTEGWTFGAI
ncbi:MAG TPA: hypothetical protein DCS24_06680 [Erythrobacter sp.]|nr:hypothetical protein [Erythrobacter sp.]